jgi:hypothetical protein
LAEVGAALPPHPAAPVLYTCLAGFFPVVLIATINYTTNTKDSNTFCNKYASADDSKPKASISLTTTLPTNSQRFESICK